MPALPTIAFDTPVPLAIGLMLAALAIAVAAFRRVRASRASHILVGLGIILLACAAGEPRAARDEDSFIAVMVDRSASMRGAFYHDEASLRTRIAELLGDRGHQVVPFGDGGEDQTTWTAPPPGAEVVLLFSDGRFDPPATAPPVYAVIDAAMVRPADAAVTSLQRRNERVIVTTANGGTPRALSISGAIASTQPIASPGRRSFSLPVAPDATASTVHILADDPWPENDGLVLAMPPSASNERWWVGGDAPGGGDWRTVAAGELPTDAAAYIAPSVIVLSNVAAASFTPVQTQRLQQHVRDLGGGLLILGGDRAFAAGGYDGSLLSAIVPLASSPPAPAAHWTFLLDASGSMAGESDGRTRLAAAVAATREAIAQLPPNDLLSVGGFSDELRWWTRGQSVNVFTLPDVPAPRGPTNLDASLRALSGSLDAGIANPIVLLTDGQVQFTATDEIAKALAAKNAHVHVLAIGAGPGIAALRQFAETTGGTFAQETDAARWTESLTTLLRAVSPQHWMTTTVEVRFATLPPVIAPAWNRTWLKAGVDELARSVAENATPMAARMNLGSGKVAAVAFRPPDEHIEALAALVASPPRDPRLNVTWRTGRELVIDIDAADATAPLNGLSPTLVLSRPEGSNESFAVPQTGPGRYGLTLAAPRSSTLATLHESGRIVDRFAVAGRYAPEFDGIGNDRAALTSLAQRTGGRVIEPTDRGALQVPGHGTDLSIARHLAGAGALLVGLGLLRWWRRSH